MQQNSPYYYYRSRSDKKYFSSDNLIYYFFNYRGRICRAEYWIANAFIWCITLFISILTIFISRLFVDTAILLRSQVDVIAFFWQLGAGMIFLIGFIVVTSFASYMLAIKRAHDRDNPGWFVLFSFVPIANLWVLIELGFLRGTDGDNPYGNDPRLRYESAYPGGNAYGPAGGGYGPAAPQQTGPFAQYTPSAPPQGRQAPPRGVQQHAVKGPALIAMSGEYAGAKVPIDAKGIIIGRDPARCNLVMASKDVSRVHARVTYLGMEKKFLVEDLKSRNGIYIGRERINGRAKISPGESFTLSEDAATFMVNFT